ncbi:MAG: acyl-CoA dehydrogenase family protein [Halobacteria archaeon]
MVDFSIPKPLASVRDLIHQLALHKLRPISREFDEREHEIPWDLVHELHRMGKVMGGGVFPGAGDPAARGPEGGGDGAGASTAFLMALVAEELAWGDEGLFPVIPVPGLGGAAVEAAGTPEQRKRWLSRFPGEKPTWAAMAMTEPGSGSDTASIRTTARREGGEWVLNGEKIFCTNGQLALEKSSGFVVVWARILPAGAKSLDEVQDHAGMRGFVVPAGTPGARVTKVEKKMGLRGWNTVSIILEDVRLPLENMLGEPLPETPSPRASSGFRGAMATFDATRPQVSALAIGVGRAALDFARELLAKNGVVPRYGLSPVRLSGVEREFIRAEADLHAARLLNWRACWLLDRKVPNNLEAAMAKAKAGQAATEAALRCAELAGPLGYSRKHLLEKWVRDAKLNDIGEGTAQVCRLVIARRILGYSREQLT